MMFCLLIIFLDRDIFRSFSFGEEKDNARFLRSFYVTMAVVYAFNHVSFIEHIRRIKI